MRAWFRSFVTACWLLRATAAHGALSDASTIASPAPERLLITVVTTEAALPTFEQRVSSWFSDGTQVTVVLAREVTPELILTTAPGELRVCVVPRDSTHALVTFATQQAEDSRHLLRDVRLRDGFDELGLERLASVIHSAAMALREGVEGAARADAERDLEELGLLPATDSAPPSPPPRSAEVTAPRRPARRKAQRMSWLLGAEYGARARGAEALGHGPGALLGLQLPSAHGSIDVVLRAQALLRSVFDAGPIRVSLQTTALRAAVGIEPELAPGWFLQALLGGGVDFARIHPSSRQVAASEPGGQWRGAGELALGVWKRTAHLDFGVQASCSFLLGDVHYTLEHDSGEERLITPWPVQPALSLQARFWGPL